MKHFILAITFLTRIVIPNKYTFTDSDFGKSIWNYPFVGLLMGGILAGVCYGFGEFQMNTDLSSFILLVVYIGLSGGLHLDGLADVCDGIFSGRSREKIFEIMKDSRVGSFGAIGIVIYLLGMWIALRYADWQTVLIFPIIGRSAILLSAGISSYAKETGMGKTVVDAAHRSHVIYAIGITSVVTICVDYRLIIPVMLSFLIVLVVTRYVSKILGGITGDVMGMLVEVSQLIFLLLGVFY